MMKDKKIKMIFVNNTEEKQLHSEMFGAFIKNIGPDPRSKIREWKTKKRIIDFFRDMEKGNVYAKCTKCGSPPEKIYIDSDGVQVSYETRLLHDIREIMKQVDQKVLNLELKIEMMEHGQEILEESLAYINKYIIQKD